MTVGRLGSLNGRKETPTHCSVLSSSMLWWAEHPQFSLWWRPSASLLVSRLLTESELVFESLSLRLHSCPSSVNGLRSSACRPSANTLCSLAYRRTSVVAVKSSWLTFTFTRTEGWNWATFTSSTFFSFNVTVNFYTKWFCRLDLLSFLHKTWRVYKMCLCFSQQTSCLWFGLTVTIFLSNFSKTLMEKRNFSVSHTSTTSTVKPAFTPVTDSKSPDDVMEERTAVSSRNTLLHQIRLKVLVFYWSIQILAGQNYKSELMKKKTMTYICWLTFNYFRQKSSAVCVSPGRCHQNKWFSRGRFQGIEMRWLMRWCIPLLCLRIIEF